MANNAATIAEETIETTAAEVSDAEPGGEQSAAAYMHGQLDLMGTNLDQLRQRLADLVDVVTVCSATAGDDLQFVGCFAAELERRREVA